jgi:hypothetical protein
MIKVGNTSFEEATIKKMSFKDFKETYKGIIKSEDLKPVFEKVTGLKPSVREEKPEEKPEDFDNLG